MNSREVMLAGVLSFCVVLTMVLVASWSGVELKSAQPIQGGYRGPTSLGEATVNGASWMAPLPFDTGTGRLDRCTSLQQHGQEAGFSSMEPADGNRYANCTGDVPLPQVPTIN